MDVSDSNKIISTIKLLRENVYCKENFKQSFSDQLKSIGAIDVLYIPEQFGGWSININTSTTHIDSGTCVKIIADILINTINMINSKIIHYSNLISSNLINVIITGPKSFVIKI